MGLEWEYNDKENLLIAAAKIPSLEILPLTGHRQEDRADGLLVLQHQQAGDSAGSEE